RQAAAPDRATLAYAHLFELYHAWHGEFDAQIAAQEARPDEAVPVRFAPALLSELARRGFARDEAAQQLALFFQLRRAYVFIERALVGDSACMQSLREALWNNIFTRDVRRYASYLVGRMEDFSTLLLGETGTGKGSAAMAIGQSGFIPFDARTGRFAESFARAFVSLNLSEYPEALLESELFGHEKGAFTGAVARRAGALARCSPHGSILLDEIGELAIPVQVKLLRVLQERVFVPVGGARAQRFPGRVIAATNRPLAELRGGRLRDDFFYRLCSDVIVVPPLRRRLEESPAELAALVERLLVRLLGAGGLELVQPVQSALVGSLGPRYPWPGNVRELEQAVRRVLLTGGYEGGGASHGPAPLEPFLVAVQAGALDADALLGGYCARLFAATRSYAEVARRAKLDRRTARRYAELGARA
ncbi:MAG: sigma 54-interacting transcriptional regulator, partial [Planctomycetota bacterium]